jgi:hypothetical protein
MLEAKVNQCCSDTAQHPTVAAELPYIQRVAAWSEDDPLGVGAFHAFPTHPPMPLVFSPSALFTPWYDCQMACATMDRNCFIGPGLEPNGVTRLRVRFG